MNKKAYFEIVSIMFGLMFVMLFFVVLMLMYSQLGRECDVIALSKLKAVDGKYDKNTGLFSGGSVGEKTLAFENGLIMSYKGNKELWIGKKYSVTKCEDNGGRVWFELK